MPTVEDDRTVAMQQLIGAVQPETAPTLNEEELGEILDQCLRATYWLPSETHRHGAAVMPSVFNGHRYRADKSGVSASTEPNWPLGQGAKVRDGEVVWIEDGPDYVSAYNVELAIHLAWQRKLAKASNCTDWKAGGISNSGSQVFENLEKMVRMTQPFEVA